MIQSLFCHLKWRLTAHQWSSIILATIIRLNKLSFRFPYLMFPLLQSPSECLHLGLFLFQEQIVLPLFSYQFHFRFFQPLGKGKDIPTQKIHKQFSIINELYPKLFTISKTTICQGSVTKTPRMYAEVALSYFVTKVNNVIVII